MPGKKPSDSSWRWITQFVQLRSVGVADVSLAAVAQMLDLRRPESAASTSLTNGYDNVLQVAFAFPAAGTATAELWVELVPEGGVAAWYKVSTFTVTNNQIFSQRDVPIGRAKIMVTNVTGGPVTIACARSE
jgi:hypothetical protein